MSIKSLVFRTVAGLVILGISGNAFAEVIKTTQSVSVPVTQSLALREPQIDESESRTLISTISGLYFMNRVYRTLSEQSWLWVNAGGIPVPLPNPSYTFHHVLEFWPYNKLYTVSLYSIFKAVKKIYWFLNYSVTLIYRIISQLVDIFLMRKSLVKLSHQHGWSADDEPWLQV